MNATKVITPTAPQDIKSINTMFSSMQTLMGNLYGRWLDEQGMEDIKEYANVIQTELDKCGFADFKMVSMKKKPFGFTFKINDTEAIYQLTITTTQYKWKRTQ